jgi:TolA-binding protein
LKTIILTSVLFAILTIFPTDFVVSSETAPLHPAPKSLSEEEKAEFLKRGLEYYHLKRFGLAAKCFAEILKVEPNHVRARELFEATLSHLSKGEEEIEAEPTPLKQVAEEKEEEKVVESQKVTPVEKAQVEREEEKLFREEELEVRGPRRVVEEEKPPVPKEEEPRAPEEELRAFNIAKDLLKHELYNEAIDGFRAFLRDYPRSVLEEEVLFTLANCLLDLENLDEALANYRRLVEDYPEGKYVEEAQLKIGEIQLMMGNPRQALIEFIRFHNTYPESAIYHKATLGAGRAYYAEGEFRKALVSFERVIREGKDADICAEAIFHLAKTYEEAPQVRSFHKALYWYKKLIEEYPLSIWTPQAKERKEYIERHYM